MDWIGSWMEIDWWWNKMVKYDEQIYVTLDDKLKILESGILDW